MISILNTAAALVRRWREDRATMLALARLDERSRRDFHDLVRQHKDAAEIGEFNSKSRSVRPQRLAHIAVEAVNDHASRRVLCP